MSPLIFAVMVPLAVPGDVQARVVCRGNVGPVCGEAVRLLEGRNVFRC